MGDAPPHEGNTQLTVQEDVDEHFAKTFCYKAGTKKPQRHLIYWGFDDWRRERDSPDTTIFVDFSGV